MSHIYKNSLKQSLLFGIYNDIKTNNNAYYYYIGKGDAWENEDIVPNVINSLSYETSVKNNIIYMKKININDVAFIIPRYDWESGTTFAKYDNDNIDLENSMFYCLTTANNVYKCIDNNNNSPSTIQPYATSHNIITLADGYKWKYMYTIPISIIEQFETSDYIPVISALSGEYFSRGSIYSATINNYGAGYTKNTILIVDGNGHQLNNKLNVIGFGLSTHGSGYLRSPTVTITSPHDSAVPFVNNTEYLMGELIEYNNNIYEVILGGISSPNVYPMHTCICSDIVNNGTLALKFVAKRISGSTSMAGLSGVEKYALGDLYLNGFAGDVTIINGGYGYDENNPPSVLIEAPELAEGEILNPNDIATGTAVITNGRINNIIITNHGAHYTALQLTIRIAPPFNNAIAFSPESTVLENTIIEYDSLYYRAINAGTLSSTPPTHESGTVVNGDVDLTMVGEQATAIATTYYGYGYNNNPIITISQPHLYNFSPTLFTQNAAIEENVLVYMDVYHYITNNSGTFGTTDLLTPLDVDFTDTQLNGDVSLTYLNIIREYVEDVVCNTGDILRVLEDGEEPRFYEVLDDITISTLPTHISGTSDNLLYIPVISATATITTEKTRAKFFPVVENGQIVAAICNDPGVGYTYAKITAYESYFGVGSSVDIIPNISKNSTTTKQEYVELSAVSGTIDTITVTNPGTNYNVSPEVIIQGDGVGCTAVATLVFGSISKVDVVSPGKDYTYATITFKRDITDTLENAIEATAIPIISPYAGHGNNAITELYANKLAITTNIGEEVINGALLNNTYRQFGIIRNPLQYSRNLRYNNSTASACYSVVCSMAGHIDISLPLVDINNNEYIILSYVASASNQNQANMIIHATNNSKLVLGDVLSQNDGQTITNATVISIKNPDVNKQSGDILTIDNREAFFSNDEQSVLLKTIINI